MSETTTIDINAGLDRVWTELIDITAWPKWSASMTSVNRLDDGPLREGSRARVKQPRMPSMTWTVTELADQSSFVWAAKTPGVVTLGTHRITANPDGSTHLVLGVEHSGQMSGLIGRMTGARTRRYMALEAAALKAASEA
ncbi:MAG TPA: SRPBCC family protein [Micromonosporaceae bacterium]